MDAISVGVSDAINSAYSRALFWLIIKSLSLGINSSFIYLQFVKQTPFHGIGIHQMFGES